MPFDYPLFASVLVAALIVLFFAGCLVRAALRTWGLPVCWNCGATKVRRSGSPSFLATLISIWFIEPYRCRGCRVRFYGFRTHRQLAEDH